MKKLRIYADTSVFGGCFDEEFQHYSRILFDRVQKGDYIILVSPMVLEELSAAPDNVKRILITLPESAILELEETDEMTRLAEEYIRAGILPDRSRADALHIASATIAAADVLVSWNFKDIVNLSRIQAIHSINKFKGYPQIPIFSPMEVVWE